MQKHENGCVKCTGPVPNCVTITDFIAAEYSSLARCCGGLASQIKRAPSGQNILPSKADKSEDSSGREGEKGSTNLCCYSAGI